MGRILVPIALGHVAAVGLVAAAVPAALQLRLQLAGPVVAVLVAALLLALALKRFHRQGRAWALAGEVGLGVGSFCMGIAHGAGLMLLPALAPWCAAGLGAPMPSGLLLPALAAAGLHAVMMIAAATAVVAALQRLFRR